MGSDLEAKTKTSAPKQAEKKKEAAGGITVKAEASFSSWKQVRGGELPVNAASRISAGEDFDEVIISVLGDHPDAVESQIPGEYWLHESDSPDDITEAVEGYKAVALSCQADGAPVPFNTVIVPFGELDPTIVDELPDGTDVEDLSKHLSAPAAKLISTLHREASDVQAGLYSRISNLTLADWKPDDGFRYLWAYLDLWKGLWLSAETVAPGADIPDVTFVFFLMEFGLYSGDEMKGEQGDWYDLIAGQRQYALFMPAIVIGDEVPDLKITDGSDRGIQRLVIDYGSATGFPVVLHDGLV